MGLARSIVARVRQYVGDRRHSKRRRVRLSFSIFVAGPARSLNGSPQVKSLKGHTLDISPGGMSLIVPAIRIGEHHLVADNRELNLSLELPSGPIEMKIAPVRYESLDDDKSERGFLIGVRIMDTSPADRLKFEEYLSTLVER